MLCLHTEVKRGESSEGALRRRRTTSSCQRMLSEQLSTAGAGCTQHWQHLPRRGLPLLCCTTMVQILDKSSYAQLVGPTGAEGIARAVARQNALCRPLQLQISAGSCPQLSRLQAHPQAPAHYVRYLLIKALLGTKSRHKEAF